MSLEALLEALKNRDVYRLANLLYNEDVDKLRKYDVYPNDIVRDAVERLVKLLGLDDADVFTSCPTYVDEDCKVAIVRNGKVYTSYLSELDVEKLRQVLA